MQPITPKPQRRGALRLWLGVRFFRARRWLWWHTSGVKFARRRPGAECPVVCARHATPLMRKLKDVDMWLQENKVINLRLAAARLDGMLLRPGETFSYWRCIGNPTRRKGYVEGMMLKNGGFTAHIGGGLCQMSNLIYWMTLHTPLTVVERHRHGYSTLLCWPLPWRIWADSAPLTRPLWSALWPPRSCSSAPTVRFSKSREKSPPALSNKTFRTWKTVPGHMAWDRFYL